VWGERERDGYRKPLYFCRRKEYNPSKNQRIKEKNGKRFCLISEV